LPCRKKRRKRLPKESELLLAENFIHGSAKKAGQNAKEQEKGHFASPSGKEEKHSWRQGEGGDHREKKRG